MNYPTRRILVKQRAWVSTRLFQKRNPPNKTQLNSIQDMNHSINYDGDAMLPG